LALKVKRSRYKANGFESSKLGADQALSDSSKQSMLDYLMTESLVEVVAGQ